MRVRWDRIQVGDLVDMAPQPLMYVVSRRFDERSGLWVLGFLHTGWRRIWRIAYIGWHEEEVVEAWGVAHPSAPRRTGSERDFLEREIVEWMSYALDLRDLLRGQNRRLYEAARERDRLLKGVVDAD
jgi:hypothetical protein